MPSTISVIVKFTTAVGEAFISIIAVAGGAIVSDITVGGDANKDFQLFKSSRKTVANRSFPCDVFVTRPNGADRITVTCSKGFPPWNRFGI